MNNQVQVERIEEYRFAGVSESGHRLLFHTIGDHEVEVQGAEGDKPQGRLVLPSAVECDGCIYTVVVIGKQAFLQCDGLAEIIIPDTVNRIEAEAFRESGLTAVQAAGVVGIDYSAFYECKQLASVELSNLEWMGISAFSRCGQLEYFPLPDTLQEIPNWAFDFAAFTEVRIPNSVRRIGDQAFFNNEKLAKVIIPSSVVDICTEAFVGTAIRSVVIPNPDAGVRYNAFPEGCEVIHVK